MLNVLKTQASVSTNHHAMTTGPEGQSSSLTLSLLSCSPVFHNPSLQSVPAVHLSSFLLQSISPICQSVSPVLFSISPIHFSSLSSIHLSIIYQQFISLVCSTNSSLWSSSPIHLFSCLTNPLHYLTNPSLQFVSLVHLPSLSHESSSQVCFTNPLQYLTNHLSGLSHQSTSPVCPTNPSLQSVSPIHLFSLSH